jgi:3-methylfumaryl-CoA hydratase
MIIHGRLFRVKCKNQTQEYAMPESTNQQLTQRSEVCHLATVRRLAAMLDLAPDWLADGDPLPRGWHFFLLAGETRRSALRSDGFPGFGVPLPDLGLPRLLLSGRTVAYLGDIPIGAPVARTSFVKSLTEKSTAAGPMAIVTIHHALRPLSAPTPAIIETQTYFLVSGKHVQKLTDNAPSAIQAEYQKIIVPDETLLFQYSALGFNSHKIHLDRDYARTVEGFPDLVVNGGLTTLLLTEFLRVDLGLVPTAIKVKHSAPLFCGRPIRLTADREGAGWRLRALDDQNVVAVDMEVTIP